MLKTLYDNTMTLKPCPGCGAMFSESSGPTHRYMESSPSCWAAFGNVLAREYSDPEYFEVHRLSVDAYAVQHPGQPSRQSIHSVGLHLIRLCLFFEHGLTSERANEAMLSAGKIKHTFTWLVPPSSLGKVTVADVVHAQTVAEHKKLVKLWAESAWQAWFSHHDTVRTWLMRSNQSFTSGTRL